jgi:TetR/AcrR family transcriptional regulator
VVRVPKVRPGALVRKSVGARAVRPRVGDAPEEKAERRTRDAAGTRKKILEAAIEEFAERGLSGARIDSIAQRSGANMRMIYHYYGNKEELYVYVLDHVYEDIRKKEAALNLGNLEPYEAMLKLFNFTYSHFAANPHVVSLWMGENLQQGVYLATSMRAPTLTSPLVEAIKTTLARGVEQGVFRSDIDALQLYVSMVALSYFHLSNVHTLSAIFSVNLHSERWKAERRRHGEEMLSAYLLSKPES